MEFHLVNSISSIGEFVKSLQSCNTIGLDVETDKLDPFTAKWILLQIEIDGSIYVFDVRKLGISNITYIIQLLKDTNKLIIGHNLKFDFKIIYHNTKEILTNCFDTMLAETMIYNGLNKNYYCSLETLVDSYFSIKLNKEIRKTFFGFDGELTNEQLYYAAEDVQYLSRIKDIQLKKLIEQKQEKVVDLEMSLVPVFMHIEYTGIYLNKEDWLKNKDNAEKQLVITKAKLMNYILDNIHFDQYENALTVVDKFKILQKNKLTKSLKATLETLRGEFIKKYFEGQFNLDSPNQLKIVLNDLGIPVEDTNEKTLMKFQKNEIVAMILDYRGYAKQISTYGIEFLKHINPTTGMVHTQYNQLGAASGRLSCVPLNSEILTNTGWKKYNQLSMGESVLGFDIQNNRYSWTKIKGIHVGKDFVGKIKTNIGHDKKYDSGIYCTENHKWILKRNDILGFGVAGKTHVGWDTILIPKLEFPEIDVSLLDKNQAFLWGWYLTDGFKTGKKNYGLGITLAKSRSIKLLQDWLDNENIPYTTHRYSYAYDKGHYLTNFHISYSIFTPIYNLVKSISPSDLVIHLSKESREAMFLAMLEGDGSMRRNSKRYDRFGAKETQEKNTGDYFELLSVSLGHPYTSRVYKTFGREPFTNYQLIQTDKYATKNSPWKSEYETDVWCPETELGTWVMKQGHYVCITGNSENPNLQNQPRLQSFRACYQARPGYVVGTFDYSQAELRLLGDFTKEWELINTFIAGKDPHSKTATFLYPKPIEEINHDERHDGKTLNFGSVYGITPWGLYRNFGIPLDIGEEWIRKYYDGYKTLKVVQEVTGNVIWEKKYSTTLMGRKRYFEDKRVFADYRERDKYIAKTKREGFNHIIQGGIGDIVKIAMRDIFYENPFGHDKLRILLQTHDELCVEIAEDIKDAGVKFVDDKMLKAEKLFLNHTPEKLDNFVGNCWMKE